MLHPGKVLSVALIILFLLTACTPAEEEGLECIESWECGEGYTCEVGYCVELPDDGTGIVDKDTVLPEGTDTNDAGTDVTTDEATEGNDPAVEQDEINEETDDAVIPEEDLIDDEMMIEEDVAVTDDQTTTEEDVVVAEEDAAFENDPVVDEDTVMVDEDTAVPDEDGDTPPSCPTGLSLGSWASGDDGWSHDNNWWTRASGNMHLDYTADHSSSYTQDLTYTTDIYLAGCASATLSFAVQLNDDYTYAAGSDKSEKLYVQCSGDAGANWTSMTPNPWPSSDQSGECGGLPGYCAGGPGNDWSFAKTNQTIDIPVACRTAQARFRFHATGDTTWSLLAPGWQIYPVTVN
ncbi:MAG TPA: hypothetical protein PLV42_09295 [bacterium]|nr:hypothetical protein [bacterium]